MAATRKETSNNKSLKTDLKKCTGFVNKVRLLTETNKPSLCKDIKSLKLRRYVEEIAPAMVDAKMKSSEVHVAVAVISMLHQRYEEFTEALIPGLVSLLLPSRDDKIRVYMKGPSEEMLDPAVLKKQRVTIRLLVELYLSGVMEEPDQLLHIVEAICSKPDMSKLNQEGKARMRQLTTNNITLLTSFAKYHGEEMLGVVSRKTMHIIKKCAADPVEKEQVLPGDVQAKMKVSKST